jgi:GC-rich sequence DNA-binding factor
VEINDGAPAFDASEMEGAVIENLDDMQAIISNSHAELSIPSESSIKAAKEKRDRLKKTATTEEDFIPLTVSKWGGPAGPHPESRLVREDDEMGEGDDGQWSFSTCGWKLTCSQRWQSILAHRNVLLSVRRVERTKRRNVRP